jgi:GMP synthase (glutamine-hydrolysing)
MATVLYLVHHPTWTSSRIIDVLRSMGHKVELRCPPAGDLVPHRAAEFDGIVVSGHHWSVDEGHLHPSVDAEVALARAAVEEGVPYFGMCFGAQALAAAHGCLVQGRADGVAEYGFYPLHATADGAELFDGLTHVFQSHYQACLTVPEGGVLLASSEAFEVQAFRLGPSAFGVQFHPDARLDMIEGWWPDNEYLHHHPGIQPLAEQLADAARHEEAIQGWVERFLRQWLSDRH